MDNLRKPKSSQEARNSEMTALKSLVSNYALRTRQAEHMATCLMQEKLTKDQFVAVIASNLKEHMTTRSAERVVHQQALLQALSIELSSIVKRLDTMDKSELKECMVGMIKSISLGA